MSKKTTRTILPHKRHRRRTHGYSPQFSETGSFQVGSYAPYCVRRSRRTGQSGQRPRSRSAISQGYPIVFAYSTTNNVSNAQGQITRTVTNVHRWYSVAPTACFVLVQTVYFGELFYFYGVEVGNPKSLAYGRTNARCVSPITKATVHFQYNGARRVRRAPRARRKWAW